MGLQGDNSGTFPGCPSSVHHPILTEINNTNLLRFFWVSQPYKHLTQASCLSIDLEYCAAVEMSIQRYHKSSNFISHSVDTKMLTRWCSDPGIRGDGIFPPRLLCQMDTTEFDFWDSSLAALLPARLHLPVAHSTMNSSVG